MFLGITTDTSTITRKFTLAGDVWFVEHDTINGRPTEPVDRFIYTNRHDGLYESLLRDSVTNSISPAVMAARFPSSVGDTFGTQEMTEKEFGSTGILFYRASSIDTDVTTQAGRFHSCYKYDEYVAYDTTGRVPQRTGGFSLWAPAVGLVRSFGNFPPRWGSAEYELLGYDLK